MAVALCTLPWLGFVPDKVSVAPPVAVARLAEQLKVDPEELRSYGKRAKTRTDHLRLVAQYLSWRLPTTLELKELDEFLLARAMEPEYTAPRQSTSPAATAALALGLLPGRAVKPLGPATDGSDVRVVAIDHCWSRASTWTGPADEGRLRGRVIA
ncbi:hypothetical protein F4559_003235 [Saccharothrix violaceirubra]|uniref:DUF4158 domain-containing protein n=1 Tax=Saccharothrix violaceirubra TaxID=413306 RepID=A0A7W7T3Y4_9PSEU|nr:hypothetical protein [Saccharothrix violaceirubra]